MTQMNFGIVIGATDATQGGLRSVLSGMRNLGSGVLGALRDINLGLAPTLRSFEGLVDRGSRLDATRKSFEHLSGTGGKAAIDLSEKLRNASHGMLTLSDSMNLVNKGLLGGLSTKQIATTFDFVSKKATSFGSDVAGSIEEAMTAMSRGQGRGLEHMGVLLGGLEEVRGRYDAIKGKGAFDHLGPAAQKAEIIAAAISQMEGKVGRIGLTGRETTFVFAAIKNQVEDATESLIAAITKSKALHSAMVDVRDILGGLTSHLENGGGFGDILFGKGKSGGVAGILKAGVMDVGETVGRSVAAGLLQALSQLPPLFEDVWGTFETKVVSLADILKPKIMEAVQPLTDAIGGLGGFLKNPFGGGGATPLAATTQPSVDVIPQLKAGAELAQKSAAGRIVGKAALDLTLAGATRGSRAVLNQLAVEDAAAEAVAKWTPLAGDVAGSIAKTSVSGSIGRAGLKFTATKLVPVLTVADFLYTTFKFIDELGGLVGAERDLKQAQRTLETTKQMAAHRGIGTGWGFGLDLPHESFSEMARRLAGDISSGGVFGGQSHTGEAIKRFRMDFPPSWPEAGPGLGGIDPAELELSPAGVGMRRREANLLRLQVRRERAFAAREARKKAADRVLQLRRQGYMVTRSQRKTIERDRYEEMVGQRTRAATDRLSDIAEEMDNSGHLRASRQIESITRRAGAYVAAHAGGGAAALAASNEAGRQATELMKKMNEVITEFKDLSPTMRSLVKAIGGTEADVKRD